MIREQRCEPVHSGCVLALERDHRQLQGSNLERSRLLLGDDDWLQRAPRRKRAAEGAIAEWAEHGRHGAAAHALGLPGVVLEQARRRGQLAQRVHVAEPGSHEGHLHAAERQHGQNSGHSELTCVTRACDEDQEAGPVGAVEDKLGGDAEESLVLAHHVAGLKLWPLVGPRAPPELTGGLTHDLRSGPGSVVRNRHDVNGRERGGALREGRVGEQHGRVHVHKPVIPLL
mmetsp:Transcript_103886/g.279165  ORF Transcript_103886/g.279165 Transcript_103886/m.279165 type:complete len:229 (-) Transcript_103886:359-1045(-)